MCTSKSSFIGKTSSLNIIVRLFLLCDRRFDDLALYSTIEKGAFEAA
jgi:hypothetical protein